MVHLYTNDLTRWPQQSNIMAMRHLATQSCWPRLSCHLISSNLMSWHCNQSIHFIYDPILRRHITTQAFIGNVPCVCLCKCTNMYNIHHIIITINPHQAYIIISTQHFDIYIIHHNVTKQGSLIAASESLAVAIAKFAVATNLSIKESSTRVYSLQREPISLQRVLSVSTNQSTILTRACSLQWESISLQWVLTVLTNHRI